MCVCVCLSHFLVWETALEFGQCKVSITHTEGLFTKIVLPFKVEGEKVKVRVCLGCLK